MFGGGAQKRASREAERAQLDYNNRALALQESQFNQSRADSMPWLTAGQDGLSGQRTLLGLGGGDAQAAAIEALRMGPEYQARYRNGEEAILQNGSATGGLRGGNMQRGLADFGEDTLARVLQERISNLGGLSSQGGATGQYLGGLGSSYANNAGSILGANGQVRANGLLTRGGITSGMWKSAGGFADQLGSALIPGGGGLLKGLGF